MGQWESENVHVIKTMDGRKLCTADRYDAENSGISKTNLYFVFLKRNLKHKQIMLLWNVLSPHA